MANDNDDGGSGSSNGLAVAEPARTAADGYARQLRRCAVMADWLVGQLEARTGGGGGADRRQADYPAAAWELADTERSLAGVLALLVGTDEPSIAAAVDEAVG